MSCRLSAPARLLLPVTLFVLAILALRLVDASPPAADATSGGTGVFWDRGTLSATIESPTSLAFGPDGRLYVASLDRITALTITPATLQVTAVETIATGLDEVTGIAFDPTAPASPVVVYASRRHEPATDGYEGVVSRFTGPSWTRTDVITGLPNSTPHTNHYTNGLAFDSLGRLYIAQGSDSDSGLQTPYYPETPLSAAILRADIHAPGFNGTLTYSPAGTPANDNVDLVGGDVSVFAAGTRNPYDLVLHSNGQIYATDNGPTGPETSLTCATQGPPPGGISNADELNRIVEGNYYGFPNRNRGRTDPRQCTYRRPEDGDGGGATGPIAVLPNHCSCDGLAEYTGSAFGGALTGDLVLAQFTFGQIARVDLAPDGLSVASVTALATGFSLPLDVIVGADGTIFIAEWSGDRVAFLAPDSDHDGCSDARENSGSQMIGGQRNLKNFWDFFDTPGPGNVRDQAITVADISRIVSRFGSSGTATAVSDALTAPPAAPAYHAAFDRTLKGPDPWRTGPANGSITIEDITRSVSSFGHSCA
jgi:glucose/arabinose dehydrogenase